MAENPSFYNHLSGREFLSFSSHLLGLPRHRMDAGVARVLDLVSMARHADRKLRTYSKGMLQRVALAQALLGWLRWGWECFGHGELWRPVRAPKPDPSRAG